MTESELLSAPPEPTNESYAVATRNFGVTNANYIRQVGLRKWTTRIAHLQFRKRVLMRDTRLTLPTGLTMVLPRQSRSATEVFVTDADVDWGAEALFTRFAERDRDFLDVGAHVGYYSTYLAPRVRRAYAFEPDPRNLPALCLNARIAGNVSVIEAAVSSRDGQAPLFSGQGSATASLEGRAGAAHVAVPTVRIDTFADAHPELYPALIKTDVEGHDLEALRGMRRTVARCQPLILTECPDGDALGALCQSWGYSIFAFTRDPRTMGLSFRSMGAADFQAQWFKMLFLVPSCLQPRMAAHAVGR